VFPLGYALLWIITTPSLFEHFFSKSPEEAPRPGGADLQRFLQINHDYGYSILVDAPSHSAEDV
jgi:hypothetical protein